MAMRWAKRMKRIHTDTEFREYIENDNKTEYSSNTENDNEEE